MRTITEIGSDNYSYFAPLMPEVTPGDNVLMLGVIEDDKAAGALASVLENEVASIIALMVAEEDRRKGIGKELVDSFMNLAEHVGVEGVLAVYPEEKEDLNSFFDALGFWIEEGEPVYSIELKDLFSSERVQKKLAAADRDSCRSLSSLSPGEKDQLTALLLEAGYSLQDQQDLGMDPDLSFTLFAQGRPQGVVIAGREEKDLFIHLLYDRQPAGPETPILLLAACLSEARELTYLERLVFVAGKGSVVSLAKNMADHPEMLKRENPVKKAVMPLLTARQRRRMEEDQAAAENTSGVREPTEGEGSAFPVRRYRTTLGELMARPLYVKQKNAKLLARPLSALRPAEYKAFTAFAEACSHGGGGERIWDHSPDCSGVVERNGKPNSFLLVKLGSDGRVYMDDLYLKLGENRDFYELVLLSIRQLAGRLPESTPVYYVCRREEGAKLVEHFYPGLDYEIVK